MEGQCNGELHDSGGGADSSSGCAAGAEPPNWGASGKVSGSSGGAAPAEPTGGSSSGGLLCAATGAGPEALMYSVASGALQPLAGGVAAVDLSGLGPMNASQVADVAEFAAALSPCSFLGHDAAGRAICESSARVRLAEEGHPWAQFTEAYWELAQRAAGSMPSGDPVLVVLAPGTSPFAAFLARGVKQVAHDHGPGATHTTLEGHPGAYVSGGVHGGGLARRIQHLVARNALAACLPLPPPRYAAG